jgi:hypothetical protein
MEIEEDFFGQENKEFLEILRKEFFSLELPKNEDALQSNLKVMYDIPLELDND